MNVFRSSALAALLLAAAPFAAKADQISFSSLPNTGTTTFGASYCTNASGCGSEAYGAVNFSPSAPAANAAVSGSSTGAFQPFNFGQASFSNFNYVNNSAAGTTFQLFDLVSGNNTLIFDVDTSSLFGSLDTSVQCKTPTCLNVTGTGTYYATVNGVTTEYTGNFTLQLSGGGTGAASVVSFQDSNITNLAVTPEPSSLLLMGTGLVGAGGVLLRRRRGVEGIIG